MSKTKLQLTVKTASKKAVVGFNNSGAPLGERSQEDLLDLAIMARQSGSKNLLAHFEELPPLKDLLEAKADAALDNQEETGTTVTAPGLQGAGAAPNPVTTPAAGNGQDAAQETPGSPAGAAGGKPAGK